MKFSAAYMSVVAFLAMKACATPVNVTQRETVATPQLKTGAANEVDLLTVCTDPGCKGDCSTDNDCSGFESFLKTSTEIDFVSDASFISDFITLMHIRKKQCKASIHYCADASVWLSTLVRPKPIARRYLGRGNTLVRREDVERRLKINNLPSRDREEMAVQALASVAIRLARKNNAFDTGAGFSAADSPQGTAGRLWQAPLRGAASLKVKMLPVRLAILAIVKMVTSYLRSRAKIPYGRDYETVPVSTGVPRMTPSNAHLVIKDGKTSNCGVRGDAVGTSLCRILRQIITWFMRLEAVEQ
ncbi:hypothetical protein C8J56DRAFT_900029 [Mycena floridula]|nr:hypothetical protein C8J56DRAFT_900029 [Mycena floridula]